MANVYNSEEIFILQWEYIEEWSIEWWNFNSWQTVGCYCFAKAVHSLAKLRTANLCLSVFPFIYSCLVRHLTVIVLLAPTCERTKGSLTPCLVAACPESTVVCWRPHLAGTRQYNSLVVHPEKVHYFRSFFQTERDMDKKFANRLQMFPLWPRGV